jgi:hypothetical protein
MLWIDQHIADLERQIATLNTSLSQLRSGELKLHEGVGSGPTIDISAEALKVTEGAINQLQRLLVVLRRSNPN